MSCLKDGLSTGRRGATALARLDEVRVAFLGKKGLLTSQLKSLGKLAAEDRPLAGQQINAAKRALSEALEARKARLQRMSLDSETGDRDTGRNPAGSRTRDAAACTRSRGPWSILSRCFCRRVSWLKKGPKSKMSFIISKR